MVTRVRVLASGLYVCPNVSDVKMTELKKKGKEKSFQAAYLRDRGGFTASYLQDCPSSLAGVLEPLKNVQSMYTFLHCAKRWQLFQGCSKE